MRGLNLRLSILMFLQFGTWGAWTPVLGRHLENIGFSPLQISSVYGTGALALMIAPLLAGQAADRWFRTERFLSLSFLGAAVLFFIAAQSRHYQSVWWLSLGAMLCFGPTLGLANSLAFHHLEDARRDFPKVRVWGTVGWIVAGWALSQWMTLTGRSIGDCLNAAGVFATVASVYSLTLPKTPPRREGSSNAFAFGKVLAMLRDPSFALFSLLAFVLMVFATFYYFRAGNFFPTVGISDARLPLVMSIGQVSEIVMMFVLPQAYRTLGAKWTIAIGIAAWGLRFGIFALGAPLELVMGAQALHGVCFAFASAATMVYIERLCPLDVRASAQSFLAFLTFGLGMFAGAFLGGFVSEHAAGSWRAVWLVPTFGCVFVLAVFVIGFRARDERPTALVEVS